MSKQQLKQSSKPKETKRRRVNQSGCQTVMEEGSELSQIIDFLGVTSAASTFERMYQSCSHRSTTICGVYPFTLRVG